MQPIMKEMPATKITSSQREEFYRALVNKDPAYEGVFIAAVRTTGIFCRPTCHARKPKPENVAFFSDAREALQYGYRPCKLCRPMEPLGTTPEWLRSLIDEIHEHPQQRIKDQDLRERNLEPARVRRWFQKQHGMTFHAYARALRLGHAFGRIRQGDAVAPAALGSGYDSLSGFAASFKQATGRSPSESRERNLVRVTRIPTPLGPMIAGATEDGICLLEFVDRRMLETQLARLRKHLQAEILPGTSPLFELLSEQLTEYFEGVRIDFDVPLTTPGTAFQERVWAALQAIPYGETRTYAEQAEAIGQPTATRAVARANGDNRIAILIPCHRVIGKNGSLTGYGGGLWRKRYLLDLEKRSR